MTAWLFMCTVRLCSIGFVSNCVRLFYVVFQNPKNVNFTFFELLSTFSNTIGYYIQNRQILLNTVSLCGHFLVRPRQPQIALFSSSLN